MLKPILKPLIIADVDQGSDSPVVTCEACGTARPSHKMINVMIGCGSPGHPAVPGFQCPYIEHWACSTNCWRAVAHACVDEHMHMTLQRIHEQIEAIEDTDEKD